MALGIHGVRFSGLGGTRLGKSKSGISTGSVHIKGLRSKLPSVRGFSKQAFGKSVLNKAGK